MADISSLLASSGVTRFTKASMGMKLEPLAKIGNSPSERQKNGTVDGALGVRGLDQLENEPTT